MATGMEGLGAMLVGIGQAYAGQATQAAMNSLLCGTTYTTNTTATDWVDGGYAYYYQPQQLAQQIGVTLQPMMQQVQAYAEPVVKGFSRFIDELRHEIKAWHGDLR